MRNLLSILESKPRRNNRKGKC